MTGRKIGWMSLGLAALSLSIFAGCDNSDGGGVGDNPKVPAGIDVTDNSEMFMWKIQQDGASGCPEPRVVTRWPSYLVRNYGVTGGNSYVMAGSTRMEFYRYDSDWGGTKPSYACCNRRATDFEPNQKVVLYKNGKALAFAIVPDPGARYFAPLP